MTKTFVHNFLQTDFGIYEAVGYAELYSKLYYSLAGFEKLLFFN